MELIGTSRLHYQIIEKLGEGGMGVVYKAFDTKLKRDVAIKFLPWQYATIPDVRTRFRIEAQAAATLNHPNIATIYAIEEMPGPEDEREIFFVMEYIDGMELKQRIKEGPISLQDALQIALHIAEGLHTAHEHGITHRDIKPSNIMLTAKGRVKLMDFGLAKIGRGIQLTKTNTTLGTLAYMSPEQARGETVDYRSDIWSFGVLLYEMLCNALPFEENYEHALIYSIVNNPPILLVERRGDLPPALTEIVEGTLQKDPDERYQDMQVLIDDLNQVQQVLRNRALLGQLDDTQAAVGLQTALARQEDSDLAPFTPREEPIPTSHAGAAPPERSIAPMVIMLAVLVPVAAFATYFLLSSPSSPTRSDPPAVAMNGDPPPPPTAQPTETSVPAPEVDNTDRSDTPISSPAVEPDATPAVVSSSPIAAELDEPAPTQAAVSPAPVDTLHARELQKQQAAQARDELLLTRNQLTSEMSILSTLATFDKAVAAQRQADQAFERGAYTEATELYTSALAGVQAAEIEATAVEKLHAQQGKRALDQLIAALPPGSADLPAFREVTARIQDGDEAFSQNAFAQSNKQYNEALQLVQGMANQLARQDEEKRRVDSLVDDATMALKTAFESEDINRLEQIFALSDADRDIWRNTFLAFRNFTFEMTRQQLNHIDADRYVLDCDVKVRYINNKNAPDDADLPLRLPLVRGEQGWKHEKFQYK
ncbi:MAG: protein kinase [Rhodothermales bacterium]